MEARSGFTHDLNGKSNRDVKRSKRRDDWTNLCKRTLARSIHQTEVNNIKTSECICFTGQEGRFQIEVHLDLTFAEEARA